MFPLLEQDAPNPLELFQIWLNLPAADKLVDAYFSMLWDGDIPRVRHEGVEVTVIAGDLEGVDAPTPPPNSWAAHPEADVAIWHVVLDAGATWTIPAAAGAETIRTLYVFEGGGVSVAGEAVPPRHGAVVRCDQDVELRADERVEILVLQGRPIGEPVAKYGPFVMNTEAEIEQAFADYRETQFGGWPWPTEEPVHHGSEGRFARHPDGRRDQPA